MSTITRPISRLIHWSIRWLTYLGCFIGRELVDMSTEMLVDMSTEISVDTAYMLTDTLVKCRLICRPIYRSRGAQNTHDLPRVLGFMHHWQGHEAMLHGLWIYDARAVFNSVTKVVTLTNHKNAAKHVHVLADTKYSRKCADGLQVCSVVDGKRFLSKTHALPAVCIFLTPSLKCYRVT